MGTNEIAKDAVVLADNQAGSANLSLTKDIFGFGVASQNVEESWCPYLACCGNSWSNCCGEGLTNPPGSKCTSCGGDCMCIVDHCYECDNCECCCIETCVTGKPRCP